MEFGAYKTPVEDALEKVKVRLEVLILETFILILMRYKKSWKEFDQLKNIDRKSYCSDYYHVCVNKFCVKCEIPLRFWENNGWINEKDPYGWFHLCFRYWLGRRSRDNKREINRWKKIVSRFRGKLLKMLKDASSKFDDYSISPRIRRILLYWGYELTEKDFLLT